jgi:hypothetical protein
MIDPVYVLWLIRLRNRCHPEQSEGSRPNRSPPCTRDRFPDRGVEMEHQRAEIPIATKFASGGHDFSRAANHRKGRAALAAEAFNENV